MPARAFASLVGAAALALCVLGSAAADGEAGLVIQDGNTVRTYCVAFTGDGIRGDQLLTRAGQTFDAYGGGSGLAVCSINERGCNDAGSFASCFCQCQGGDCTYWAFFTQEYGKGWVYSSRAFNLLSAGDGDVHGWKWGSGAPNSAPVPQPITFEQICGHPPGGGVAPTATAASIQATATSAPPIATAPATSTTSSASPGGSATAAASAAPNIAANTPVSGSVTPLVTLPGMASPTPAPPETAAPETEDESSGGSGAGLAVLAGVVGVLAVAIVAATVWRNRRGS